MKKYKYKNKIYTAIQFLGYNWAECEDFAASETLIHPSIMADYNVISVKSKAKRKKAPLIKVFKNDYIIKDEKGNIDTITADLFGIFYEEV